MPLNVAEHAGYCYGVRRAVETALAAAKEYGGCVTLGPIIHNPQAVARLAEVGAVPVDNVRDVPEGGVCVIRSHGETPETYSELEARGVRIVDATCPTVRRIHDLVEKAANEGRDIAVIGAAEHPEVRGILGWARGRGVAVRTAEEASRLKGKRMLAVAQTTIPAEQYRMVAACLGEDTEICETTCRATAIRREEAAAIARGADAMVIVGGANSSNTRELLELCRAVCPRSVRIETADEIDPSAYRAGDRIGITAGASTPEGIFKEVVARMNDIENIIENAENAVETPIAEDDFAAQWEQTLRQIRPGQTVTGTVVQITEDEVCVNVGYKADGIVKKADLTSTDVQIGDEIEVEVVKVNDGEGNVLLSQKNIVNRKAWDAIVAAEEAGEFVEGIGKEAVKGGLIAMIDGIRAFVPASQLSNRYVEKIEEFAGQTMKLKIIELDKTKKRVVASRKAVLAVEAAEKKKAIWENLEAGSVVKGTVRRLTDFGAFVDIGGVDGLVHVTELSWGRVRHPSDVVTVGQEIDVKISSVDPERERISLSYKATQPRPWTVAGEKYPVGAVVQGKVVRITTFGAFVELEPGLDGLVHISQCAPTRIEKVEDAVKVDDIVNVKILDVNSETKRISLSIRAALEDAALTEIPEDADEFAIEETTEQA